MKGSKLINILKTFSKEEMKLFEKFVASPYFNNGKNCAPLLKRLQKFYPDFDDEKLTNENIYKKLYPRKNFNKQVIWNLNSAMEKMAEEFIAQLGMRNDKFGRMGYIVHHYNERKLKNLHAAMLHTIDKFCKARVREDDYFYYLSELERMWREYHLNEDKQNLL
jgi:hypothetical protein